MKKSHLNVMMSFALVAILFSTGCVPAKVTKLSEDNKDTYEEAFKNKVKEELGSDYTLSDIECKIIDWEKPGLVFSPDGSVSKGSRYEADNALTARLFTDDSDYYEAKYYWLTDSLDTNALYPTIVDDYASKYLGLDPDKIVYRELCDTEIKSFIIDSDIRTADEFFSRFQGFGWYMTIVTEEDISNKDYSDYAALCHENEIAYGVSINIYSTDEMANLSEFKAKHHDIRWSDHPGVKPSLDYVPEDENDIFDRYNFNNAIRISFPSRGEQVKVIQF